MAQPKKPPLSVRLPDELLDLVDAWAAGASITRNAAISRLLADGLAFHGVQPTRDETRAAISKAESEPMRMPRAVPGSLLKKGKKP